MPENDAATARRQPLSPRRGQHFFETSPEAEEVRFATDSLLEEAGFEPSVPLARVSLDSREGEGAGGRSDRLEKTPSFSRGTSGSNPSSSSGESGANLIFGHPEPAPSGVPQPDDGARRSRNPRNVGQMNFFQV